MDTFALVATVVLVAFIAWIVARNLGKPSRRRHGTGAGGGTVGSSWSSGGSGRRNDADHDAGGDAGSGDGGGGGD